MVHATSAELCGGPGPADLRVNLSRLEAPQATEELKELLFSMADSLSLADSQFSLLTFFFLATCAF